MLKDKTPPKLICDTVYQLKCGTVILSSSGENGRPIKTRIDEHKKSFQKKNSAASAIAKHDINTGHAIYSDNTWVIDREQEMYVGKSREAIHIRKTHRGQNRDGGLELDQINKPHLFKEDITVKLGTL